MKIKTLAIVAMSALSLTSAAALADTTTVNGGTVHFKGEVVNAACAVDAGSVEQTVQLGQVRSENWLLRAAPVLRSVSTFSLMIVIPACQPKPLSRFLARPLIPPTTPYWHCRALLPVAPLTLASRSSTTKAPHWRWTAQPLAQQQP